VVELSRRWSAQNVLRSAAIARRVGLHPSDLECLDLLLLGGPCTAGDIMAHTGLTSGAVTAMVDRLVRRGLVSRARDTTDRRRIQVTVDRQAIAPIATFFASGALRWESLLAEFTQAELAIVERFLGQALAAAVELTAELRDSESEGESAQPTPLAEHSGRARE
jgi:DNA-binding MarR family transcriptional regulator